jgi:hypothetical protein
VKDSRKMKFAILGQVEVLSTFEYEPSTDSQNGLLQEQRTQIEIVMNYTQREISLCRIPTRRYVPIRQVDSVQAVLISFSHARLPSPPEVRSGWRASFQS